MTRVQQSAVHSIMNCRTSALGGLKAVCQDCDNEFYLYRSCGNRNCPRCQSIKQMRWVESRKSEFIDATYYHAVFTVPAELNSIFLKYQQKCYNLLFKSVSETLLSMGEDPRYLGGQIGFVAILHTWGSTLSYHPHLHVMILGIGLKGGLMPINPKHKDYLFPVKALSRLFRGKFLSGLKTLNLSECVDYDSLYAQDWVVYMKDNLPQSSHVVEYLGRYTHRIAISDSRIVTHDDSHVTFRYKDYKDHSSIKEMTLQKSEFTRRYLMHVLPKGFRKVRFYGLLANRSKEEKLELLRNFLKCRKVQDHFKGKNTVQILKLKYGQNACSCRKCGSDRFSYFRVPPIYENTS